MAKSSSMSFQFFLSLFPITLPPMYGRMNRPRQRRTKRNEEQDKKVIFTTYTSISIVCFQKFLSSAQKSLLLYIPSFSNTMRTYRRQKSSSKQCHDSNTVQPNHANRHHQVLLLYIFIYIFIFYNLKIFISSLNDKK